MRRHGGAARTAGLRPAVVTSDFFRGGGAFAADSRHEQAGIQARRFVPASGDLPPSRGTDWPLLAVGSHGRGRTIAWATDIGPHWLSQDFLGWPFYGRLMANMVRWLAGDE
ncbi:glutamine amidotransferase [Mesorhizobium sp. M0106]|uniref:glutamine amidotransferase n=1 Tax=Mesorhizobium sp. M0106 TaxID=2956880 RepID=UPI003336B36B